MDLGQVLFIGGDSRTLASVQVRGVEIAQQLGCDFITRPRLVTQIPEKYSVFVCVKAPFSPPELAQLAQRGKVVWDILDEFPPRENIAVYLTSNTLAKHLFEAEGRVECIPHRHINFEGQLSPPGNRRPTWIGSRHWLPTLPGLEFDIYYTEGRSREEIVTDYRRTGIGLNFRGETALREKINQHLGAAPLAERERKAQNLFDFHLAINSGIKLINCLGFGIPSISSEEPAYHEFGEGCTIFSRPEDCAQWVRALQNDDDLYRAMRKKCLRQAKRFHRDAIAEEYRKLLLSL